MLRSLVGSEMCIRDSYQSVTSTDTVRVTGLLRESETLRAPASWFQSTQKSPDGYWFVRKPELMAAARKEEIHTGSWYIDRGGEKPNEIPLGGTTRISFRNSHLEYALTWFGLAVTLFGVFFVFCLKKE